MVKDSTLIIFIGVNLTFSNVFLRLAKISRRYLGSPDRFIFLGVVYSRTNYFYYIFFIHFMRTGLNIGARILKSYIKPPPPQQATGTLQFH